MKNAIQLLITTFLLLTISSCEPNQIKFNKTTWTKRVDGIYLDREKMVEDLMANHLHKGMRYKELKDLLGEPENYSDLEENTVAYGIMEDYGWNIDPVETKTLRIELTKDSLVSGYKIIHWKN